MTTVYPVNISRDQQRVLHALAQGAIIRHELNAKKRIVHIECVTREGWLLSNCTMSIFQALRRKGLIASRDGQPYRITRKGLVAVRSQPDNR
jgi:uncharacterized protein YjhX (UPF0386 family)